MRNEDRLTVLILSFNLNGTKKDNRNGFDNVKITNSIKVTKVFPTKVIASNKGKCTHGFCLILRKIKHVIYSIS